MSNSGIDFSQEGEAKAPLASFSGNAMARQDPRKPVKGVLLNRSTA
jgi:hypothetical protein